MPRKSKKITADNYIYAYYQQISNGSILVGKWIQLLYEYIIAKLESKELIFDQKKASDAVEWIETHSFHTEGPLSPQQLNLELWQKALISCLLFVLVGGV